MSVDTSMRYGAGRLEVPAGFENILWLISQEVMRDHPENLLEFISTFLQDLVIIRQKTGLDPVVMSGALAEVQGAYAQLREERSSQVSSALI